MSRRIDQDHRRFREIVRGKIKQNLRKYISQGEMLGKKGKETVSIPLPTIDIPHFRYGGKQQGGVSQGNGKPGDQIGRGEEQEGEGGKKAGEGAGEHLLEVDVSLEELAAILGEELELPRILPKGKERIVAFKDKYTGIRSTGPESLKHFRRTFKQALRRQIAAGTYDPKNPIIVPTRDDKRYRSWKTTPLPQSNAVIIYMMDVSGSMGDEQKEVVRIESFWLDTWLKSQYQGLESRYVIHDAIAKEVDRETFFRTRESGGTMISSAYKLCAKMIEDEYPPSEWNIYPFHFSDGDNWSVDDTVTCIDLLRNQILPKVNMFCYGQVESPYGSGQFIKDLKEHFADKQEERLITSEIKGKEAIMDSIREFLGEGQMNHSTQLPPYLADMQREVEGYAKEFGLDCFDTIFEVLDYQTMNEVAAYGGFPTRYPHWRFGMDYEGLSKGYEYGLSKIYEMVINNDPCYAYLLEGNSLVDQKMVMAHVFGHNDFFKNNFYFSRTNRKMIDGMANHATRVRRHIERHGIEKIETFIDVCLSLDNLIDPHSAYLPIHNAASSEPVEEQAQDAPKFRAKTYMDKFINPPDFMEAQKQKRDKEKEKAANFPVRPERDVLQFLIHAAPLERWERDILEIIRDEAYYFAPQAMTKIMNEGWATYWHSKILTERALKASEIIDYADNAAGVTAMQPGQLNPYKLGVELYRHIEDRWNKGQFGKEWNECNDLAARKSWDKRLGLGKRKIFEVRKMYNDIMFIDEFFTEEFCRQEKFYAFAFNERSGNYEMESREFQKVKEKLLARLTNFGQPFIFVQDGNFENRGELLLKHRHEGGDLKISEARDTLEALARVWKRPVNLLSKVENKGKLLRYDGKEHSEKAADY